MDQPLLVHLASDDRARLSYFGTTLLMTASASALLPEGTSPASTAVTDSWMAAADVMSPVR